MLTATLATLAALAGAAVLAVAVRRTLRLVRASVVRRLPAFPSQRLDLLDLGPYVVHIEGPRTALMRPILPGVGGPLGGPRLRVHDPELGRDLPLRSAAPTRTASLTRIRLALAGFEVDHRGTFDLHAEGLPDHEGVELILTRPYGARLVAAILTIVAGGLLLVGGLVGAILAIALG